MNNTKDILEKEKREATTKDGIDPVRVGWNSAIDHLIPIVEKLVEQAKQEGAKEETEGICRIIKARIGMIELDRKQMSDTNIDFRCSFQKQNELASLIGLLETPKS